MVGKVDRVAPLAVRVGDWGLSTEMADVLIEAAIAVAVLGSLVANGRQLVPTLIPLINV